jgi:glucose-6-phosphate-specific signal transduction histidine kinase
MGNLGWRGRMKILGLLLFIIGVIIKLLTSLNLLAWVLIILGLILIIFAYLGERKTEV